MKEKNYGQRNSHLAKHRKGDYQNPATISMAIARIKTPVYKRMGNIVLIGQCLGQTMNGTKNSLGKCGNVAEDDGDGH